MADRPRRDPLVVERLLDDLHVAGAGPGLSTSTRSQVTSLARDPDRAGPIASADELCPTGTAEQETRAEPAMSTGRSLRVFALPPFAHGRR